MVLTVNGTVNGPGSLTKTGAGTNFLGGTISYAGSTTVSGGMLVLNGTKTGGSGITVGAGGVLAGIGSTTESVTNNGGAIAAGDPINNPTAKLTTGPLILNGGSGAFERGFLQRLCCREWQPGFERDCDDSVDLAK